MIVNLSTGVEIIKNDPIFFYKISRNINAKIMIH